jgi:hypothetical protein
MEWYQAFLKFNNLNFLSWSGMCVYILYKPAHKINEIGNHDFDPSKFYNCSDCWWMSDNVTNQPAIAVTSTSSCWGRASGRGEKSIQRRGSEQTHRPLPSRRAISTANKTVTKHKIKNIINVTGPTITTTSCKAHGSSFTVKETALNCTDFHSHTTPVTFSRNIPYYVSCDTMRFAINDPAPPPHNPHNTLPLHYYYYYYCCYYHRRRCLIITTTVIFLFELYHPFQY